MGIRNALVEKLTKKVIRKCACGEKNPENKIGLRRKQTHFVVFALLDRMCNKPHK